MKLKTLCGCISFSEAEYQNGYAELKAKVHYKTHPTCKGKARSSEVWKAREPIGNKLEIGEEHDPGYDESVPEC
jgi:hypothetical protein